MKIQHKDISNSNFINKYIYEKRELSLTITINTKKTFLWFTKF